MIPAIASDFKLSHTISEHFGNELISAIAAHEDFATQEAIAAHEDFAGEDIAAQKIKMYVYTPQQDDKILEIQASSQAILRTFPSCWVKQLSIFNNRLIGVPVTQNENFLFEWDISSNANLEPKKISFQDHITSIALNEALYTVFDEDKTILKWNIDKMEKELSFVGHKEAVVSLEADKGTLYTGSKDLTIKGWNCTSGVCLWTTQLDVCAYQITNFGTSLIFRTTEDQAYEFDKDSHQFINQLQANEGDLYALTSSGDSLISASRIRPSQKFLDSVCIRIWKKNKSGSLK